MIGQMNWKVSCIPIGYWVWSVRVYSNEMMKCWNNMYFSVSRKQEMDVIQTVFVTK